MMYFSPQATVLPGADTRLWGQIITPLRYDRSIATGFKWIGDNGCFSGQWNEQDWLAWLNSMIRYQPSCLMVVAPDVIGNARDTLDRFAYYAPILRQQGWPVGLVAQDGLEALEWTQDYDALFIGGSTEWKLSSAADKCIRIAKRHGKWVHVGRVNSVKRIKHFLLRDVDSADGTTICFNPTRGFQIIDKALRQSYRLLLD